MSSRLDMCVMWHAFHRFGTLPRQKWPCFIRGPFSSPFPQNTRRSLKSSSLEQISVDLLDKWHARRRLLTYFISTRLLFQFLFITSSLFLYFLVGTCSEMPVKSNFIWSTDRVSAEKSKCFRSLLSLWLDSWSAYVVLNTWKHWMRACVLPKKHLFWLTMFAVLVIYSKWGENQTKQ